jgi:CoA-transferase family III
VLDGARALGLRAQMLSLSRGGDVSTGGAARMLRAADGWCCLSLPRADDLDLVPALTENARGNSEPWAMVTAWAAQHPVAEICERAILLGLAVAEVPRVVPEPVELPWRITGLGSGGLARPTRPRVLNLGSLWAAPLCAQLLALGGAEVTDIESPGRPDGARLGTPAFYDQLHAGNHRRVLELGSVAGRTELYELIRDSDVIITGSRARALSQLGVLPEAFDDGRPRIWVTITGHLDAPDRIAFGDDAAAAGGLVCWDDAGPVFAGDAIADPLTGLLAGLAATACLHRVGGSQVEIGMREVAAFAAGMS